MSNKDLSLPATARRVIAITSAGHALCHVCEMAYPALLLSVMAEFDLSPEKAAALWTPAIVLFGLGALPTGLWADRRGTREAMNCYFLLIALSTAAVYFAQTPGGLCVTLTCVGAAMSIYHPAGLSMLSHGCRDRGLAMGINGVAGSTGLAIGPAMGIYFAQYFGWRTTYAVISIISLACWLACLRWGVDVRSNVKPSAATRPHSSARTSALVVLAILFAAMLVGGFNYRTITTALPTFLSEGPDAVPRTSDDKRTTSESPPHAGSVKREGSVKQEGLVKQGKAATPEGPVQSGGMVVFIVFALGGIGQLAGGLLADRIRPAILYPLTIAATIPCAMVMATGSRYAGVSAAGMLAIFMFAEQPLENTMIANATPSHLRSTVYGLKFILAFGVASVGLIAFGAVWGKFGLRSVFVMYSIGAAVMTAIAIVYIICRSRLGEQGT